MKSSRHLKLSASEAAVNELGNPPRSHNRSRREAGTSERAKPVSSARQRLGLLAQQLRRGASEHQEPRGALGAIRENPKDGKELRTPLDFVEDDQPPQRLEHQLRLSKPSQIARSFEVKPGHGPRAGGSDLAGERGLADLTRP